MVRTSGAPAGIERALGAPVGVERTFVLRSDGRVIAFSTMGIVP